MGVAKQQQKGYNGKHMFWRSGKTTPSQQRKPVSWTVVCGLMLFALGLISLFTGHVASDLEWYSQRLVKHGIITIGLAGRVDIRKSKYSKYLYRCSERGRNFARE